MVNAQVHSVSQQLLVGIGRLCQQVSLWFKEEAKLMEVVHSQELSRKDGEGLTMLLILAKSGAQRQIRNGLGHSVTTSTAVLNLPVLLNRRVV